MQSLEDSEQSRSKMKIIKKFFSGGFLNLILLCPFSCLFKFEWNKVVFFFPLHSTLVCSFEMDEVHHRGFIKEFNQNACCCSHSADE